MRPCTRFSQVNENEEVNEHNSIKLNETISMILRHLDIVNYFINNLKLIKTQNQKMFQLQMLMVFLWPLYCWRKVFAIEF